MASSVILKTTQMFLILLCGVLVYKAGLLDSRSVRKLSDLLLLFVMPLLSGITIPLLSVAAEFLLQLP